MMIDPALLINAYCHGIFPMAHQDGGIYWYDPDPRAIFPLDTLHVSRRLARTIRSGRFDIRFNSDFLATIQACAEPDMGREDTWISPELIDVYMVLHRLGYAHSVEAWREGHLVGGLYGVTVRGLFAGESMFSRESDASKVALVYLVEHLRERGYVLLDTQFITPHLSRLGAIEIPREQYHRRLSEALCVETSF